MNTSDVKGGSEPTKTVGPTEQQRHAFQPPFFRSLLGQTVVLILIYIGSAAVIWQYGSHNLKPFHADVGAWFWLIVAAPLICILLLSMLPTAPLAWRERPLKAAAISGDVPEPSIWHRSQPLIAPAVLLGWIALAVFALPSWIAFEQHAAEAALRKLGANFSEAKSGGLLVELPSQTSDSDLIKEAPLVERLNVAHLYLPQSQFTSLEPLKGLTNLSTLNLSNAAGITSLEPLKGLTNLVSLDLSYDTGITSLEPLAGLTNLVSLDLRNATGIHSLEPLAGLTNLGSLNLKSATGITSLEPLKSLENLSWLDLSYATGITSLEPLKGLTKLGNLYLDNAIGVTSLEPLAGLTNLATLDLRDAIRITSLEPLKGLTKLSVLNLSNATGITSVEPLKGLRNLSQLYLADATGIRSLEPLKSLRVRFYGASDGLLATMK